MTHSSDIYPNMHADTSANTNRGAPASAQRYPTFDARFDTAFQRGGADDEARDPRSVDAEPALTGTHAARISVRSEPETPSPDDAVAVIVADVVADIAVTSTTASSTPTIAASSPATPNGFLVAIVAIATILVGSGLWMFAAVRDAFGDAGAFRTESDYFVLMSATVAAPLLVVLGLATGIGVLFAYATRRRSTRS